MQAFTFWVLQVLSQIKGEIAVLIDITSPEVQKPLALSTRSHTCGKGPTIDASQIIHNMQSLFLSLKTHTKLVMCSLKKSVKETLMLQGREL